jgi:hypothetical protein
VLDDQRFVGNSGWRQNEQTFDAFRVVKSQGREPGSTARTSNRVNRVYGRIRRRASTRATVPAERGYQTKIGKISAFGYLLDFEPSRSAGVNPVRDSTSTYGLRFAGEKPAGKIKLATSPRTRTQTDYATTRSTSISTTGRPKVNATFRSSVRRGHGNPGRQRTPGVRQGIHHAARHVAQVPGLGRQVPDARRRTVSRTVRDRERHAQGRGELDTLGFIASYHDYDAEAISADYGSEWNASIAAKHKRFNLMLKYADYQQECLASARTTSKLWAQIEFIW